MHESKRNIKIIKPEYYLQIRKEFDNLTGNAVATNSATLQITEFKR